MAVFFVFKIKSSHDAVERLFWVNAVHKNLFFLDFFVIFPNFNIIRNLIISPT